MEAAERKGESAEEAWLKKLEEKLEGGGLYDEPSVVARWKERMIAQADKVCELQVDALTKRHAFEEWRVAMTELRAKLEVHQERLQHAKEDHQRAREDLVLLGLQRRIAGMRLEKEKLTIKMDTLKAAHAAEDRGHALRERDLRLREEHVERLERLVREDRMHDLMLRDIHLRCMPYVVIVRGRRVCTVSLWGVACTSHVYRTRVWNALACRRELPSILFFDSARKFGD